MASVPAPLLAAETYRALIDAIDDVVYAMEVDDVSNLMTGRVTFVGGRVQELLGYHPDDFIENPALFVSLIHPADREAVEATSRLIFESGQPGRRHFRLRHGPTGDYRWFDDSVVPQFGPDGRPRTFVGVARDVTTGRRVSQQMAILLENSRDGFFTLDAQARCTFANPAGTRMFQRPQAELLGHTLQEFLVHPEQFRFAANWVRAVGQGEVVRDSGYCHSLQLWLDVAIFPTPDGAMVYFRDVTAQRVAESRIRTWIDDAPVGLFRVTPDNRFLDVNGTTIAMLGYPTREALMALSSLDVIADPDQGVRERIQFTGTDTLSGMPVALRRFDGSEMPVLMSLRAVRDHAGDVVEILGSFEDRTDPAMLRSALLSSARRFQILFNDNVTPMIVTTVDGRVLSRNQAFARLIRCEDDATLDGILLPTLTSEPSALRRLIERAQAEARVENLELSLTRRDNTRVRVLANARVVLGQADAELVEISFVDIEDLSRAQDRLRRTLEEREFLLRELHHRVKNNLQLISSLLSLQAMESSDAALKEFAQKSRDRILAMAVVHERLYRAEGFGADCVQEYLQALVRSLADSHDAGSRGISIEVSGECVPMTFDQTMRCGLIVNELVMNSLKHGFPAMTGSIRVHVALDASDPRRVCLTVSDTGVGLPLSFDPSAARTLGTQIVDNLAHQGGGHAEWTSVAGTRVTVSLVLMPSTEPAKLEVQ